MTPTAANLIAKLVEVFTILYTGRDGFIVFHFFAIARVVDAHGFFVGLRRLRIVMFGPRCESSRISHFNFSRELRR